jgi:nucleoid-associated protein YgaU
MTVSIGKKSRLQFAPLLTEEGIEFWDLPTYPEILKQPDDGVYTVKDNDRIDSIAFRVYGEERLWWVLAVANDLELVPTELVVGADLRIPSPRYINQVYLAQAK